MTRQDQDEAFSRLAELARQTALSQPDPGLERVGRARLVARWRREARRPRRGIASLLAAAATLAIGIAALSIWLWPRPLDYEVFGIESDGPYLSAPPTRPIELRFSDGSDIHADPGSRLRVEARTSDGARVLIERGRTTVRVAHRALSSWTFAAGPFDVRVTGTRFELGWDPVAEVLDLSLREGSVEVEGPFGETPVRVRARQRFHADLSTRSMTVIDAIEDPAPVPAAPSAPVAELAPKPALSGSPEPAGSGEPASSVVSAPVASQEATAGKTSWPKLVASGDFDEVVRQSRERAQGSCEKTCSASDLRALADAARYTGRSDLAEGALLALRRRFAGSGHGSAAAFLLGRVYEKRGSASSALRFYETYLAELPGGELAAEALAGRMRTIASVRGKPAAASVAREYLARYPNGVHAQTAREILGTP